MPKEPRGWGRICAGTRLEKNVDSEFVIAWTNLVRRGLRKGDAYCFERGKMAHVAGNSLIRQFLASPCDSLFILDSDADIGPSFLNEFRDFEPGWGYDALQAFHCRRGWPPEAIWFTQRDGVNFTNMILSEGTSEVSMIGTHCALFRREIFERIYAEYGNGIPLEDFEWFCYPRHQKQSDEVQLSLEARQLGFRLGATTALKAGHLSKLTIGWETYQEYLEFSGTRRRTEVFQELAQQVGEFTGEPPGVVMAKAMEGPVIAGGSWGKAPRERPEQVRDYYSADSDYLYKVLLWNTGAVYEAITEPLKSVAGKRALVVGAGIGGEADILADRNTVSCFDLPGPMRDFAQQRLGERVAWLEGPTLQESLNGQGPAYDLVVAIDVLEHIHPDEWAETLGALGRALKPGGVFYCHNNFKEPGHPEHFDNADLFETWVGWHGLERMSEYEYRKPESA